jgi:hypothetical protein
VKYPVMRPKFEGRSGSGFAGGGALDAAAETGLEIDEAACAFHDETIGRLPIGHAG